MWNNATIHCFMYYYYALRASGKGENIWWRKYLTMGQILQFVLDGITSLPYLAIAYMGVPCRGTMRAWVVAFIVGMMLLALFNNFFVQSYTAKGDGGRFGAAGRGGEGKGKGGASKSKGSGGKGKSHKE